MPADAQRRPSVRGRSGSKASSAAKRRRPLVAALAACLAAGVALFGVTAALQGGGPVGSGPVPESLFAVRAYAVTTGSVIDGASGAIDGLIVFPMDTVTDKYSAPGAANEVYSGALFTVEGRDVERVQATLSRGELYAYAVEDFLIADNPEKAAEAGQWQPKLVGTGTYYGGYDVVTRLWDPEKMQDDPYAHVRTIKRLGPTIDMPLEEDSPACWGLWLDVGVSPSDEAANGLRATVDLEAMEGETLTVTAQFADGACQTQVIALHAGWFKGENVPAANGIADWLPTGQPISADQVPSGEGYVHTLYGTLESVSDEPHPYSLDEANRYQNEIAPTKSGIESSLEFLGTTAAVKGVPDEGAIHDASEPRTVRLGAVKEQDPVEVEISNLAWQLTDVLPDRFDLYDDTKVRSFQGNIEYMNKCRSITSHWTVDEAGRLNEGNTFVVVEFDAALPASADHESMVDTFGQVCRVDREARRTVFATAGVFAAVDTGYHDLTDPFDCAIMGRMRLRPGEVNHIALAFIADDAVAQGDGLAFACPPPPLGAAGFTREAPEASELELVRLR